MTKIWLIRHAESKSQAGETDDHLNPVLSSRGREQAGRLVERLEGLHPDRILVSPLRRAYMTYQLSAIDAERVEFDSRLVEINWGNQRAYEGIIPVVTPHIAEPDRHDAWLRSDAERIADLTKESLEWEEEQILLFGHWGFFNHLLFSFLGERASNMPARATMDNASISLLEVDEHRYRFLRYWNDRSHVLDLLVHGR